MKVCVVYIYHLGGAHGAYDNAFRFLHSYHAHPTLIDHQMIVACNGAPANEDTQLLFSSVPNCLFMEHDNSGYDIGAFQRAAQEYPCDLMVFFGNSAYIRGQGWLERMVDSYSKHGNKLYGSMENSGHIAVGVWPHIRTTGFWMDPKLLNAYPHKVTLSTQRYGFEHGRECLTSWCLQTTGALVVTWSGEYEKKYWGQIPEGFHRGSQSNLITGDKNSAPPFYRCM